MGEFARAVRFNKIAGLNQRRFDRAAWIEALNSQDAHDRELAISGCVFDGLLSSLRDQIDIHSLDLQPAAIVRVVISLANALVLEVNAELAGRPVPVDRPKGLFMNRLLQETVDVRGNQFTPDELLTGAGDALKHVLREVLSLPAHEDWRSAKAITDTDVETLQRELNSAVLYQVAVEMWLDCVGNGYRLVQRDDGIALIARAWEQERARAVSSYRRSNLALQDGAAFAEFWIHRLTPEQRRRVGGMKLVTRVFGVESIERIEVGCHDSATSMSSLATGAKFFLREGYYSHFLDEPLPLANGLSLNQIVDAWRFLHSLAHKILKSSSGRLSYKLPQLLTLAPRIRKDILVASLGRCMECDRDTAAKLVNFLIYRGRDDQEVWSQPLAELGADEVCIVIPCIYSIHLLRVVEKWMRQGGLDLERRGGGFERYCIAQLNEGLVESPIKNLTTIIPHSVEFKAGDRNEEVDVVVFVGNTILLLEAKCTLWPDDCLQYANHRDTILKAVEQVRRKRQAAMDHYAAFASRIAELGAEAPASPRIICGVLTNSAIHAGFSIDGIPVVDLGILSAFFGNSHVKFEVRKGGETVQRHELVFYEKPSQAPEKLESYLIDPPHVADAKRATSRREVVFPMESDDFGKLYYEKCCVNIDEIDMMRRYGINSAL